MSSAHHHPTSTTPV
ncbi:unnamed protein product [Spirodela intermedia]|uniref:Uncharacterized protein n=1 Tax=Spirodela intermedia TaxID=51605 RepID=A0A7I8J1V1_SPIIN|nr:unnamed protein product [Spirodela intermedia]CAA6664194.1 unnamed protein product [Spirodela intermedia]